MKSSKKIKLSQIEDNFSRNIIRDLTPSIDVTGTVSEVLLKTYLIPANTFKAEDILHVKELTAIATVVNGSSQTFKIKIGTTNSFSSAISIASGVVNIQTMNNYSRGKLGFSCIIRAGKIRTGLIVGGVLAVDYGRTMSTEIDFDTTIDNYLFTSVISSQASDTLYQNSLIITN